MSIGLYTWTTFGKCMLDAFIIEQIRKDEEQRRRDRRQQPYLPVSDRLPYTPPDTRSPSRGYLDIHRGEEEDSRDV